MCTCVCHSCVWLCIGHKVHPSLGPTGPHDTKRNLFLTKGESSTNRASASLFSSKYCSSKSCLVNAEPGPVLRAVPRRQQCSSALFPERNIHNATPLAFCDRFTSLPPTMMGTTGLWKTSFLSEKPPVRFHSWLEAGHVIGSNSGT